ncbi:hypothetical protein M514_09961 [Trichuris suis]|uniref:Uncharacterized protein n=1 Tax=Trichuris suis TaxID=68888 RepID=A0A085LVZ1_9BILA|nr:hypothetical protein M513_09961 [Trichuris suis]KFD62192.1 hypothetical protein M514_09961 [Trichuris suis]
MDRDLREDNNHRDSELKQSDLLQSGQISQTGAGHSQIALWVVLSEGHVGPTTSSCCHQHGPRPAASAGTASREWETCFVTSSALVLIQDSDATGFRPVGPYDPFGIAAHSEFQS